jgi:hypothetical protein
MGAVGGRGLQLPLGDGDAHAQRQVFFSMHAKAVAQAANGVAIVDANIKAVSSAALDTNAAITQMHASVEVLAREIRSIETSVGSFLGGVRGADAGTASPSRSTVVPLGRAA